MASCRECTNCDIDYPTTVTTCQVCHKSTAYSTERDPEPQWERKVRDYTLVQSGLDTGRLPGIHPDRVVQFEGEAYITDESLHICGYDIYPQAGDIIRVQGSVYDIFFELYGRAVQAGIPEGHERHVAGWWIRRVETGGDWVPKCIPLEEMRPDDPGQG